MEQSSGAPNDAVVSMTELQASLKDEQELNKDLLTSILGNANAEDLALYGDQQGAGSARNPMALSEIQKDTLINSLMKENQQLSTLIRHMTVDRNNAQSKAILIEQQSEETARFKTMVKDELEDHLREIRKILVLKESLIQQAEVEKVQSTEPIPSYVDPAALLVHKDIVTPSVGLLRVHEDTEVIKKEISKRVDEIQELQKKRKAIVSSTKAIRFQVAQLENALSSNSYKAKQCLLVQETVFSDDEDYNPCHFKSKVSNFNRIFQIQKIKAEKLNLQNKGLFISDVSPNNAMGTLRTQKLSQLEIEIEKYKNLSTEWHRSSEMKLKALEKLDRYNSSLLKSNAQLVEGSIRIQTKAALTNRRLRTYKRSYQTLVNLKKNRFQNLQATLKEHNNVSSQSNNNSTTLPGSFYNNNNNNESSFSPGVLNSNSSRGNGMSLGGSQYNSSGLYNNNNPIKLLSVEEEEFDENIAQRRTLTAYQSAGSKANTDLCSNPKEKQSRNADNHDTHTPWMNLKQSIEYLFKVKQQLDRCCKQAHFATSIPTSDPRYVSASSIPGQMFHTRRALSTCCDGSSRLSQALDWQQKKVVKRRNNNFMDEEEERELDVSDFIDDVRQKNKYKNNQNQEDDEGEKEDEGQLLQLPEETDETEEQEQLQLQQQQQVQQSFQKQSAPAIVQFSVLHQDNTNNNSSSNFNQGNGASNIKGGGYSKPIAYKQSYEGNNNRNETDSGSDESRNNNNNQAVFNLPPPTHNNSFFRELDISVIQVQTKNKRH